MRSPTSSEDSQLVILFKINHCILQYISGLWADWETLRFGKFPVNVDDGLMDQLMAELPKVLKKNLSTIPPCDMEHYRVAMNAVCSKDMLPKFRADLWIFMEACSYSGSCNPTDSAVVFLITEDYKFFHTFVQSPHVERLLGETATSILGTSKAVEVKLAGEVIPSL